MKKLKQILSNKNTVTFIGVILIVLVLYFFYNWRVNSAISPVRVPYAAQAIGPRTKITNDMIGYLEIQQSSMKGKVLTNANISDKEINDRIKNNIENKTEIKYKLIRIEYNQQTGKVNLIQFDENDN